MSNPTGLIVALMFATIVTMAVVNLLSLFAERLKATGGVLADVGETLWLILVMLISLSMFWQCIDILNIEDWSFTEFLFIVLGASILFFSTTSIPKFKISDSEIQRIKENSVFFCLMASFQAWLLLLDATLGAAPFFFIFFRLICFGSMIAAAVSSSAKALWLSSAAFVASLVILIVLQSLASRI
jgi:hypothetical protein